MNKHSIVPDVTFSQFSYIYMYMSEPNILFLKILKMYRGPIIKWKLQEENVKLSLQSA